MNTLALLVPFLGAALLSTEGAVRWFIYLLIAAAVFSLLYLIVQKSPFPPEVKVWLTWILWVLGALVLIGILLAAIGHPIL